MTFTSRPAARTCDESHSDFSCCLLVAGSGQAHERNVECLRYSDHSARQFNGPRSLSIDSTVRLDLKTEGYQERDVDSYYERNVRDSFSCYDGRETQRARRLGR